MVFLKHRFGFLRGAPVFRPKGISREIAEGGKKFTVSERAFPCEMTGGGRILGLYLGGWGWGVVMKQRFSGLRSAFWVAGIFVGAGFSQPALGVANVNTNCPNAPTLIGGQPDTVV